MAAPKSPDRLSNKMRAFIQEYMIDLNASQAALRAGYSPKTGRLIGQQLLLKPAVQEALSKALKEREQRTQITQDRVLEELARIAFADPRRFFNAAGKLRDLNELDEKDAAALAGFSVVKCMRRNESGELEAENITKVKFWDKNSALEKLGKHLALFVDRFEHTGKAGGPIEVVAQVTNDERAKKIREQMLKDLGAVDDGDDQSH